MKTISLKNSEGETIEIRRADDGKIQIRHSDFDRENFGDFLDVKTYLSESPANPIAHGNIVYGKLCSLNASEVEMIRDAVRKL